MDPNLQRKIVDAVGAGPGDEVLEVGPGKGALTGHLVGSVGRLVAVELDDGLAGALAERYGDRNDVTVINADILDVRLSDHVRDPGSLSVVGNIPYNITTPILFHLLGRPRPWQIVIMVQEEVADRIVAPVGSSAYGALAVGVRSVARAERLFRVGRGAFRPVPGVDSAMVRIRPFVPPPLSEAEEKALRTLVRAVFQWRRKQMGKILRDHPDLRIAPDDLRAAIRAVGVRVEDRPERISPEAFIELSRLLGT